MSTEQRPTGLVDMETVFDHNPTAEELGRLFLVPPTAEEHRATALSPDIEFARLYLLFVSRNEKLRAASYLSRIADREVRETVWLQDVLPAGWHRRHWIG